MLSLPLASLRDSEERQRRAFQTVAPACVRYVLIEKPTTPDTVQYRVAASLPLFVTVFFVLMLFFFSFFLSLWHFLRLKDLRVPAD